jgi:WD40 repeat protein
LPRWSPDGRYLAALLLDSSGLKLFDFKTSKWSKLVSGLVAYPCWSHDGRFLYFLLGNIANAEVHRMAIPNGKVEDVAVLKGFQAEGYWGGWLGLTPDDSPVTLKNAGSQEVVSMEWREP